MFTAEDKSQKSWNLYVLHWVLLWSFLNFTMDFIPCVVKWEMQSQICRIILQHMGPFFPEHVSRLYVNTIHLCETHFWCGKFPHWQPATWVGGAPFNFFGSRKVRCTPVYMYVILYEWVKKKYILHYNNKNTVWGICTLLISYINTMNCMVILISAITDVYLLKYNSFT